MTHTPPWRTLAAQALTVIGLALGLSTLAQAATVDISDTPLINLTTTAKPNMMVVLDDSGSMNWDYMPDDMSNTGAYGYRASQCNGVAYNPNVVYNAPKNPTGDAFPDMAYGAVWDNGYQPVLTAPTTSTTSLSLSTGSKTVVVGSTTGLYSGNTVVIQYYNTADTGNNVQWMLGTITNITGKTLTVNVTFATGTGTYASWYVDTPTTTALSTSSAYYFKYSGAQSPMSWDYDSAGVITSTTFYKECTSAVGLSPGSGVFTKVTVNSGSAEATNYANWYAYYRTRMQMTRTVVSRVFSDVDSNYRVGFTTISNTGVSTNKTFLDVNTFDAAQKNTFYTDMYRASPGGSTPLRGALSKAGRYFAKKVSGQTYDPVQYACQRNYTVMATDGYWNTGLETATYGPLKLDGSTNVGQQDNLENTPMWDGANSTVSTKSVRTVVTKTVTTTKHTVPLSTRTTYVFLGCLVSSAKQVTPGTGSRVDTIVSNSTTTTTTTTTKNVVTGAGGKTTTTTSTSTSSTTVPGTSTTTTGTPTWTATGGTTNSCPFLDLSGSSTTYAEGTPVDTVVSNPTTPQSDTTAPDVVTTTTSAGSTDSLADIAEYYYVTDLRTSTLGNCTGSAGVDVCNNAVSGLGRDNATTQHMTTFTIGLGVGGILNYDPNYLSQTSGDYVNLVNGTTLWPVASPTATAANIDDLWHAAVNGRGQYFSATSPDILSASLSSIFSTISATPGSGAAAGVSSLIPVQGVDQIYLAQYATENWTGDIVAYDFALNSATNTVTLTPSWSAQAGLDGQSAATAASRSIYYMKTTTVGATTTRALRAFNYTNLNADGYGTSFANMCSQTSAPTQCTSLSTAQKTLANTGSNMVNFLRGDPSYELTVNNTNPLYRHRTHTLGDIVGSSPVYVGSAPFSYADSGYSAYKASTATRKPMLYAGANDGMLHAFSADNKGAQDAGTELWAFVPTMVMPNLYKLADRGYPNNHRFFVNASPVIADIKVGSTWKTILVGGLGAGGKGYYALDITNPSAPVALWEFTNANLGYTFAEPVVTKRADGTWVVVVSSGYNNTTGDGNGHLFMIDAGTGALLLDIPTYTGYTTGTTPTGIPAGTSAVPSNLGKVGTWVEDPVNNTALRFYSGDQLGYLWRFDTDNLVQPNRAALPLAKLQVSATVPQPISARPETAAVNYGSTSYPVVFVGTGRYVGSSDLTDTTQQSVYAIKDPMTSTGWDTLHGSSNMVQKVATLNATTGAVTVASSTVDWSAKAGWYMDLPTSGERMFVDMSLQNDTLSLVTSQPVVNAACTASGKSWLYELGISDGSLPVSEMLGNYVATGINTVDTGGASSVLITRSDGGLTSRQGPAKAPGNASVRRTSWRELY